MSDFDPYLKWLGIRDPQRPPNHYRLLGLELFESDPEVINAAADRQMVHVRSFQIGPHGEASQEILNQLAEARRCLLNDSKRSEYDASLKPNPVAPPTNQLPRTPPPIAATIPGQANEEKAIKASAARKTKSTTQATRSIVLALSIISGGIAAIVVGYFLIQSGTVPVASGVNPITGEKIDQPANVDEPPSKPTPKPAVEAPTIQPTRPEPVEPKPTPVQPEKPKVNPRQPVERKPKRLANAKAPWDVIRKPPIPSIIRSPRTELDRLLRNTRIEVGLRNFTEAQSEWLKVKSKVNKVTQEIELLEELRDQRDFWRKVTEAAAKMKPDTKLEMGKQEVMVERVLDDGLILIFNGKQSKFFDTTRENLDRDLAYAIVKVSPELHDYPVAKFIDADLIHWRADLEKLKANPVEGFAGMDPAVPPEGPEPVKVPFKTGNNAATILNPTKRIPIPEDSSEIAEARKTVRNFYKEGYEKQRSANQRTEIAQQMILAGVEELDDSATRYALLTESVEICKSCGETKAGIQALETLNRYFEIDYWNEAKDFIVAAAKKINSSRQLEEAADSFRELSITALKSGKYDVAFYLANKGTAVAQKIGDLALYNNAVLLKNETKEIDRIFSRASKAENTIEDDPDNAKANEDLGTFYCLVKGDFEKGLRYWSKSNKSAFERIAEMEMKYDESKAKDKELKIADAWFELGEDKKTYADARCLARAKHWYDLARPDTTGLYLRKVTSKIAEIDALMEKLPSVLNENLAFDEQSFFNVEWQFGEYFTASFRDFGSVLIRTYRANRPGSFTSKSLSWEKVGTEYHVANEDDNTTIVFRPRISGQTISFEKIHNQTREVLLRGVGVPKP